MASASRAVIDRLEIASAFEPHTVGVFRRWLLEIVANRQASHEGRHHRHDGDQRPDYAAKNVVRKGLHRFRLLRAPIAGYQS